MKHFQRLLFLLILLASTMQAALAQQGRRMDSSQTRWRLGVVNGSSFNWFTDEQPHSGFAIAYNAHFLVDYFIGKRWFIRATAGYTGYGGQLTTFKDDTRYGFDPMFTFKNVKQSQYIIHSIDSWLSLNYEIPSAQQWKCNLGVGVGMANNVGEYEQYTKTGEFVQGIYGSVFGNQYTDLFEPNWYHANATAEILLPSKKINWLIQGSYIVGLTGVRKSYSYIEYPGVTGSIRTDAFQLKLGISKRLKHKK
ncbi:outer membrane beta-barrel protein [Asinibacterium sp. OR53]|uniref:outer membrane beta-barrel protein n=1 Tax=Asinibacterium sp. OR53 TaxID=925409 RepID=UPI0018DE6722|nr:outer membrane beta-barrel protein [Asinibacterium sp. OR53]